MDIYRNVKLANWFIERGIKEDKRLTQMQIQKLIYFAHALKLTSKGESFVNGSFQAWEYGPVLEDLYGFTQSWGEKPLHQLLAAPNSKGELIFPITKNKSDLEIMESTWNVFSGLTRIELSNLSHVRGGPWDKAYLNAFNKEMSDESIKQYYQTWLKKN
jgi:uncharacterized phage-associated protein